MNPEEMLKNIMRQLAPYDRLTVQSIQQSPHRLWRRTKITYYQASIIKESKMKHSDLSEIFGVNLKTIADIKDNWPLKKGYRRIIRQQ